MCSLMVTVQHKGILNRVNRFSALMLDHLVDSKMMEISNIVLLLLLALFSFIYLSKHKLIKGRWTKDEGVTSSLPPGGTGFPLIGETLNYYLKIRKGCQFEFVRDRTEKFSCKIFRTWLLRHPMVVVGSAEGNKFLFSNENKLVKVWWPSTMDKLYPKADKQPNTGHMPRLRNIITPLIQKADGLHDYIGVMDEVMKRHLETYWTGKAEVRTVEMAKMFTLALGCYVFLGIFDVKQVEELTEQGSLMDELESALFGMPVNLPGTRLHRGLQASKILRSRVEAMVRLKKQDLEHNYKNTSGSPTAAPLLPVKDLIALMLSDVDENGDFLEEGDIASHLVGLIEAGYTSLHTTITMLLKSLAELPHIYDAVLKEQNEIACSKGPGDRLRWEDFRKMKYSWNVVCEVLRLSSPGIGGFREALTDINFEGYTIPKGWKIHWLLQSTHKNPDYFRDPDKFDPSRYDGDGPTPYTFVPFGGGSRMCPGNEFSRLAILTFLHYMVTQYRWEKILPNEGLLYYPVPYPVQGLPIRLHPHGASNF